MCLGEQYYPWYYAPKGNVSLSAAGRTYTFVRISRTPREPAVRFPFDET
jgi:hypothetical protein